MGSTKRLVAGVLLVGAWLSTAWAEGLPKVAEFYFDEDPAAKPLHALPAGQADVVEQLMKLRERGRKGLEATAQLADIAYADGRDELAAKLYQEAYASVSESSLQTRSLRWNQGWSLYRRGEMGAALGLWTKAADGARGNPSWVPPTLALALWKQGDRAQAVAWYAAAVRTEPSQWRSADGFAQLLPTWTDAERAQLAEVQQAWAASPPAWP